MRKLILILFLTLCYQCAWGACTTISRTNNTSNEILTSAKYNADHNTAYSAINSLDGECVQSGTIGLDQLNTTEMAAIFDAVREGCEVTKSNDSTLSVDKCYLAVNGELVTTTVAQTVSFGCTGCAAETASTGYYLFAADGSTGSTLTLKILSGAPDANSYDSSSNRVLAKFYNDGSSNIDASSIEQWHVNQFNTQTDGVVKMPSATRPRKYILLYGGASITTGCSASPCTLYRESESGWATVVRYGAGAYQVNFAASVQNGEVPSCTWQATINGNYAYAQTNSITASQWDIFTKTNTAGAANTSGWIECTFY
jgi:hypothetical protein